MRGGDLQGESADRLRAAVGADKLDIGAADGRGGRSREDKRSFVAGSEA